eukprot:TRINITY_DN5587_c0_g1_i1.p1 TRINITY_DN5587_c0_g1~~TRINITY_DN5587_c0_g1_i1.p1  ORF type:complete len:177 (+),score=67.69 TRINITY_DN5587_c0_g1_i1:127-657(+)
MKKRDLNEEEMENEMINIKKHKSDDYHEAAEIIKIFSDLSSLARKMVIGGLKKVVGKKIREDESDMDTNNTSKVVTNQNNDNNMPKKNPFLNTFFMPNQTMTLFVKTFGRKEITVNISSKAKVLQLKQQIQETEGIPLEQQNLLFSGNQLVDEFTLSDYNIQKESTLHMILKLRGD